MIEILMTFRRPHVIIVECEEINRHRKDRSPKPKVTLFARNSLCEQSRAIIHFLVIHAHIFSVYIISVIYNIDRMLRAL